MCVTLVFSPVGISHSPLAGTPHPPHRAVAGYPIIQPHPQWEGEILGVDGARENEVGIKEREEESKFCLSLSLSLSLSVSVCVWREWGLYLQDVLH